MREYEERYCSVCGMAFTPRRINQMTCAREECKAARTRQHQVEWHKMHREETLEAKRKYMYNQRHGIEPVQDTIVAIGYAERQIAATLARAGKVKTEL